MVELIDKKFRTNRRQTVFIVKEFKGLGKISSHVSNYISVNRLMKRLGYEE